MTDARGTPGKYPEPNGWFLLRAHLGHVTDIVCLTAGKSEATENANTNPESLIPGFPFIFIDTTSSLMRLFVRLQGSSARGCLVAWLAQALLEGHTHTDSPFILA